MYRDRVSPTTGDMVWGGSYSPPVVPRKNSLHKWYVLVHFVSQLSIIFSLYLLRGGLAVGRWTCDLQVAGSIPGGSAFT